MPTKKVSKKESKKFQKVSKNFPKNSVKVSLDSFPDGHLLKQIAQVKTDESGYPIYDSDWEKDDPSGARPVPEWAQTVKKDVRHAAESWLLKKAAAKENAKKTEQSTEKVAEAYTPDPEMQRILEAFKHLAASKHGWQALDDDDIDKLIEAGVRAIKLEQEVQSQADCLDEMQTALREMTSELAELRRELDEVKHQPTVGSISLTPGFGTTPNLTTTLTSTEELPF